MCEEHEKAREVAGKSKIYSNYLNLYLVLKGNRNRREKIFREFAVKIIIIIN